jgi:hypothetical protein
LASAFASNASPESSTAVSWTVTQRVSKSTPYELMSFWSSVKMPPVGCVASMPWNVIGVCVRAESTCRACSLPPFVTSCLSTGISRYTKLLGLRALLPAGDAPPGGRRPRSSPARDPVRLVGVEVHAGEVPELGALVTLEQEVRAVPVAGVRPVEPAPVQVRVLVRLGLARLDVPGRGLGERRVGYQRAVGQVPVVGGQPGRVLQLVAAQCGDGLEQLGG